MTVPDSGDDESTAIADLLFRSVFRRTPDPAGRAAVRNALAAGDTMPDLLRRMVASEEFRSARLTRRAGGGGGGAVYDPAQDDELVRHLTPQVAARSTALRAATPVPRPAFDAAATQAVARMTVECPGMAHQDEYLAMHRERFFELDSLAAIFVQEGVSGKAEVLDVGFSTNTMLLQMLLPEVTVSVLDRFPGASLPPSLTGRYFHVDLTSTDLDDLTLDYRADVILFAEVIEHLMANPVRVLAFLVRHLAPDGRLVVTTPNVFRRAVLDKIADRRNPQFVLPAGASAGDLPHFHVREYAMKELLDFAEQAGGRIEAFFHSSCWDDADAQATLPPDQWSNLVVVIARA